MQRAARDKGQFPFPAPPGSLAQAARTVATKASVPKWTWSSLDRELWQDLIQASDIFWPLLRTQALKQYFDRPSTCRPKLNDSRQTISLRQSKKIAVHAFVSRTGGTHQQRLNWSLYIHRSLSYLQAGACSLMCYWIIPEFKGLPCLNKLTKSCVRGKGIKFRWGTIPD